MIRVARVTIIATATGLFICGATHAKQPAQSASALANLLAGRYDNAAQVAAGRPILGSHPPQHVTVTIEPTPKPRWQLWHVHMDVDPAVARKAGSATRLDALWAMHIVRTSDGKSLQLVPYSLKRSVDEAGVKASTFKMSHWYAVSHCELIVKSLKPHMKAMTIPSRRCLAEKLALGGRRAFLPDWIERKGDVLDIQIIYFGVPWHVEARRVTNREHG